MSQSTYVIPCVCGATVPTPERESPCPACGRILAVEWGSEPVVFTGKVAAIEEIAAAERKHQRDRGDAEHAAVAKGQAALFDARPNALEPSR
jgi:hypothetical protein